MARLGNDQRRSQTLFPAGLQRRSLLAASPVLCFAEVIP
jgi:hypothetical protein